MDLRNTNYSRPVSRSQQPPTQPQTTSDSSARNPTSQNDGNTSTLRQEILANTGSNAPTSQGPSSGNLDSPTRAASIGASSNKSGGSRPDPRQRPGLFQRMTGGSFRSSKNNNDVSSMPLSMRPSMIDAGRQPTIRIRRPAGSGQNNIAPTSAAAAAAAQNQYDGADFGHGGRRRSTSDPNRGLVGTGAPLRSVHSSTDAGPSGHMDVMPKITEGSSNHTRTLGHNHRVDDSPEPQSDVHDFDNRSNFDKGSNAEFGDEYRQDLVDVLDTIDPEVSTLTTLTNVQNSLFVPDLGRFLSRRPVYTLSQDQTHKAHRPMTARAPTVIQEEKEPISSTGPSSTTPRKHPRKDPRRPQLTHTTTIDSTLSENRYAVLPHGRDLSGWTQAEKDELNDHVRHMLHSRRSKFKRGMKGFGQYVRRPLGFLVTLYAVLITLFGLAWVLFLIGWINVGGKQSETINIIDYVLVALFAIMGDGLAPFRAWDTYNMAFITHYHRKSWNLRKQKALPKLPNKNDLPELREDEAGIDEAKLGDYVVLSDEDHAKLLKHENRFCRSHTFYKPHETETHFAFPIKLLVVIVTLLDLHSCLQISLGAVTWGIDHEQRHPAITTVILCCSITCNITAGVLITIGDRRTRKKDVVERMQRQELTEEAIRLVEQRRIEALEEEHGKEAVAAARKSLHMQRAAKSQTSTSDPVGFIEVEKQASKGSITGKFTGIFGITKKGEKAPPVDKGQHHAPGTVVMQGGKEIKRSVSTPGDVEAAEILRAEKERQKYKKEKEERERKEKKEKQEHKERKELKEREEQARKHDDSKGPDAST